MYLPARLDEVCTKFAFIERDNLYHNKYKLIIIQITSTMLKNFQFKFNLKKNKLKNPYLKFSGEYLTMRSYNLIDNYFLFN